VAGEVQDRCAPVQRDAEPALRFRVDFSAKRVQDIHNVLHFEIGIERMSEDRVENFALMVIHGRAQFGFDKIWANNAATSLFGPHHRRVNPDISCRGRARALRLTRCAAGGVGLSS
jgi:hypothetical protein